ncbi:MAG: MBL fold metallo-hydrolase [Candidatus Hydrothermarchaeota archaeon]
MIDVIKEGILIRDSAGSILEARSTITLIRDDVLVDCGFYGDDELLLKGLKKRGILPKDIETVIFTHLHDDHTANCFLFKESKFIAHRYEEIIPEVMDIDFIWLEKDQSIDEEIRVIHTPGHTRGSISIIVDKTAIVGDAIPTENNYIKWVPPGVNYNHEVALSSMEKIIREAEFIVPGHDKPFRVRKKNGF